MARLIGSRTVGRYLESVALAVVLALVSAVPVAWALQAGLDRLAIEMVGWHPLGTEQALVLAFGSVIPAGLLGGTVGGLVWTRRPTIAPVAALSVAWVVGIVALPLVAAAFDIPLQAGIVCADACRPLLSNDDPLGGIPAYGEALLASLVTFPYLAIPAALLLLARRFRRTALSMVAWLSAHAALHFWTIGGGGGLIYAVLMLGVVLWTGWSWARDVELPAFRTIIRRWTLALAPAAVAIAVTWSSASSAWIPNVPEQVPGTLVGTAEVHGFNPPDPSDWLPQLVVPRFPNGRGYFDPVVQPAGRLELCWEGYRDNRERLPGADYYQFRLLATLHSTTPTSWVAIDILVPGEERTYVGHLWPSGVLDGPCRTTAVEGMNFLTDGDMTNDVAEDVACGRTTAATSDGGRRHWVIWTCAACGADEASGRQIAIREIVGSPEGSVPTWEIYAELGQ
jgi:hypothetical protein